MEYGALIVSCYSVGVCLSQSGQLYGPALIDKGLGFDSLAKLRNFFHVQNAHTVAELATSLLVTRLYLWFHGDYSHQVPWLMSGVYPAHPHIRLFCHAFLNRQFTYTV